MSENKVNPPKWQIQGSRVYANGHSFNCTNIVTAKDLHHILTTYEKEKQLNHTIGKDLKTIIMDLKILKHDIKKVMEKIE